MEHRDKQILVSEEASEWFLRLKDDGLAAAEQEEYLQWLKASPDHIAEALRMGRMFARLRRVGVKGCLLHGTKRFIFASSCSVYGQNDDEVSETSETNPISLYARCKVESEKAILSCVAGGLSPTILRLSTVHGWSYRQRLDLVINHLAVQAAAERKIRIFGGSQWRPFLSVRDVTRSIISVLQADTLAIRGQVFNVGDTSENYRLADIGALVKEVIPGVEVEVLADATDARSYRVNFDKIKRELGFTAQYTVRETLIDLYRAYEQEAQFRDFKDARYHNLLALR